MVSGVRKVVWGPFWTALSLDLMERGQEPVGLATTGCQGTGAPGTPLDVDTRLNSLLSRKLLSSPGLLIEAKGAYAQAGEGILPHPGLLTFSSFLTYIRGARPLPSLVSLVSHIPVAAFVS